MPAITLSKNEILEALENATHLTGQNPNSIKIIFSPVSINANNLKDVAQAYAAVRGAHFESVVVIESYSGILEKKLAMPSAPEFKSYLGSVCADDRLRNEFCDEEDDFFISDEGLNEDMSLYNQLPVLQTTLGSFNVVSLQIGDYDPAIVRELAYVLSELMMHKNALLVFCCDLPHCNTHELKHLRMLIETDNESGLLHYLNSREKTIKGARTFMTGILVARSWDMDIQLLEGKNAEFISGIATYKRAVMK